MMQKRAVICFAVALFQLLSCVQLSATPWTAVRQASLSFTISRSLLKLMSIELMMPSNHLILCHLLLLKEIKGFSVVNEADVFLLFPCFFCDPTDAGNLICLSIAFSKSSLYIWKFSVHVLLKPSLKDFEHYLARMWNKHNYAVVWTFFGIALLWDWNETNLSPVLCPCRFFQICWHIECSPLH